METSINAINSIVIKEEGLPAFGYISAVERLSLTSLRLACVI